MFLINLLVTHRWLLFYLRVQYPHATPCTPECAFPPSLPPTTPLVLCRSWLCPSPYLKDWSQVCPPTHLPSASILLSMLLPRQAPRLCPWSIVHCCAHLDFFMLPCPLPPPVAHWAYPYCSGSHGVKQTVNPSYPGPKTSSEQPSKYYLVLPLFSSPLPSLSLPLPGPGNGCCNHSHILVFEEPAEEPSSLWEWTESLACTPGKLA